MKKTLRIWRPGPRWARRTNECGNCVKADTPSERLTAVSSFIGGDVTGIWMRRPRHRSVNESAASTSSDVAVGKTAMFWACRIMRYILLDAVYDSTRDGVDVVTHSPAIDCHRFFRSSLALHTNPWSYVWRRGRIRGPGLEANTYYSACVATQGHCYWLKQIWLGRGHCSSFV